MVHYVAQSKRTLRLGKNSVDGSLTAKNVDNTWVRISVLNYDSRVMKCHEGKRHLDHHLDHTLAGTPPGYGKLQDPRSRCLDGATRTKFLESFSKLPMRYEENYGGTDGVVKFLVDGHGYSLFLTSTQALLSLNKPDAESNCYLWTHQLSLMMRNQNQRSSGPQPSCRLSPEG